MWTALCSDQVINHSLIMKDRTLYPVPSKGYIWGSQLGGEVVSGDSEKPVTTQD